MIAPLQTRVAHPPAAQSPPRDLTACPNADKQSGQPLSLSSRPGRSWPRPAGRLQGRRQGRHRRRPRADRPPARSGMSRRASPLPRRRDQARPHLHDGVPRHDGPGAGHHLPGLHQPRWPVQFSDIPDGMGPGGRHIPLGLFQIVARRLRRDRRHARGPAGGPQNLPGGPGGRRHDRGRLPVHGAIGRHGAQPRPHVELQNRAAMLRVRRHVPLVRRLCDHHLAPITPTTCSPANKGPSPALF